MKRSRRRHFEHLEDRHLLAADFVISEFLASNQNGLLDEDGDSSDWIELFNAGDQAGSLSQFALTDSDNNLTQWRLPDVTLPAGETLLVFASGKDHANANSELHTNFKLSASGEFLALVEPDGITIASAYAPQYPAQVSNVSYGIAIDGGTRGFFTTPTPGAANPFNAVSDPTRQIVINELMYHPSSDNDTEEYIELHNVGSNIVDVSGWSFTNGVNFTFPTANISANGFLVVAADVPAFQAKYPDVTNVVGPWSGKLSNGGETIELQDASGEIIDALTYADEGDWSQRALDEPDQGTQGWIWLDDHDGGGKSLELHNANLPNEYGQNWSASFANQGTPGITNSRASSNIAPLVLDASHSPAIPNANDSVTVSTRLLNETSLVVSAVLSWRVGEEGYTQLEMLDDGQNGDLIAGDGMLSAQIPPHSDGTVVEFYILAVDTSGNERTWPAQTSNAGQSANLLYQVDNDFDATNWVPGSAPIYFEVMTDAERETFRQIDRDSDAQMNATLISVTGTGTEVRYNTGVRIRGSGSRNDNPPNNRINIPSDRPLQGVTSMNVNSRSAVNQVAGSAVFRLAGLPAAEAKGVVLKSNGQDLFDGERVYAHLEPLNSEFVANQFPLDSNGNLYKGRRPNESPEGSLGAGLRYFGEDPVAYGGYIKQTNESEADWSDVIQLTDVLNNASDADFLTEVEKVVDIDQWMRFFAVNVLIDNTENGLVRGDPLGDDYSMYRGINDTRFKMVVHDLDSLFSDTENSIFRMLGVDALDRLVTHPAVLPRYYAQLEDVARNLAKTPQLELALREALRNISSQNQIDNIMQFISERADFILSQIPTQSLTASSELPVVGEFHRATSDQVALTGTASAVAGSVLVNGEVTTLTGRERTWSVGSGNDGPAETLVARGSVWSYLDDGSNQGTAWREPDFADASWATGAAELGYGDNDEQTEISFGPDSGNKFITSYFRHEFDAANVADIASLKLGLVRDDGAAVYLNGVEIARDNLADDAEFDTRATNAITGNAEDTFFEFSIDPALLIEGTNVIAAEVHQGVIQSSDLSFNLDLEAFRQGDVEGLRLNPGVNRLMIQSYSGENGSGDLVDATSIDIWYDDGNVANVSGTLPASPVTWTAAEGPYRVSGTVVVPADGQLTIEPGTTVYFEAGSKLEANGILIAQGTEFSRIRFTSVPNSPLVPNEPNGSNGLPDAPPHWDGIQYVDSVHPENLISYADVEYAQDSDGAIGAHNSELIVDNVTFAGTHLRMFKSDDSSVIVQNSFFPNMFADDEIPAQLGLDNVSEQINMTGSIPADGHLIIRNNVLGTNKGHNDVIDAVSGRRPDPILQVLDNVFLGSGDEELDLGGDVYVAGNLFMNIFKDDETSDRGYANAISTGDNGSDTTTVVARNVFWNVDHAINLKRQSSTIFENNTVVGIHDDFNDRFDNPNIGSVINFYVDEPGATAGTGAYAGGNIFWDAPRVFGNADQIGTTTALQLNNNLLTSELAQTTIGTRAGTILDLGVGNTVGDPRFVDAANGDFQLRPGSEGLTSASFGTDWLGIELGAGASANIAVVGQPLGSTGDRNTTLTVGGPGLFAYRYRVNGGPWSDDLPIGAGATAGFVPNNTVRTAEIPLANLPVGTQTIEVLGQDFAGEWQAEPTTVSWQVAASGKIQISEVLASNTSILSGTGASPDYIELQNVGGSAVNLRGYSISDRADDLRKFTFDTDTMVPPGGYLVVNADTLGFGLSKAGDSVLLTSPAAVDGAVIDSVTFGSQVDNLSISRGSSADDWHLSLPTPAAANKVQPTGDATALKINEWLASDDTLGDFIELYNPDTLPVPLAGLYLTDELGGAPTRHQIQPLSFVAAEGFVAMSTDQANNLSFKLSSDQEILALLNHQQELIDIVAYYPQTRNVSQGREPAGANQLQFFDTPTPGRANGAAATGDFNADGNYTTSDLDLLYAVIGSQNARDVAEFDLTSDGFLDDNDISFWVTSLAGRKLGDIDLDGNVGFSDFLILSANFGKQDAGGWSAGDLTGDKEIGFADFLLLSQNFGEE